jgi:hypothetical protein
MDILIGLVIFGMVIYLLPYIIAGAMMLVMLMGAALAFVVVGIRALFKKG